MGLPRLIILVRHAQSEGNKNRDIHQTIPDHRVKLTPEGWTQAYDAGRRLRKLLRADDTLHFFTSPYRRTRETTEGILSTLTSDDPSPSPFPKKSIKVYEEPRLREQDFGNFQPCSAEMERMWQERADYGHFFYRIPNGESAADAYDRVSGFNESLWRQFGEDDCASVCVLVTHGLMSRVFLMKWYHFSVEYFEDLRNVNHCEFLIMRKREDSGKYILENNLRTWSELKRERLAAASSKDSASKDASSKDKTSTTATEKDKEKEKKLAAPTETTNPGSVSPIPVRKKWGGCPNGCEHGKHYFKKENSMHAMQQNGRTPSFQNNTSTTTGTGTPEPIQMRRPAASKRWQSSSDEDEDDPRGRVGAPSPGLVSGPVTVDVQRSLDEMVSSPDGTPSFISVEDRMRSYLKSPNSSAHPHTHQKEHQHCGKVKSVGRDFGGSASGNTSQAGSDTEVSEEDKVKTVPKDWDGKDGVPYRMERKAGREASGMRSSAKADALGDQIDVGSDAGSDAEDEADNATVEVLKELEEKEKFDKSVRGSVY